MIDNIYSAVKNIFYGILQKVKLVIFGEKRIYGLAAFSVFVVLLSFYLSILQAPLDFPVENIFRIEKGATLEKIAQKLEKENLVRSPFFLRSIVILLGGEKKVFAGSYSFEKKQNVFTIAHRVVNGIFDLRPIIIQIPEGTTIEGIAKIISQKVDFFDTETFLALSKKDEGYLFPDTYYFPPNVAPAEVVSVMKRTFNEKIKGISEKIDQFGRPLDEVIIMASLLEKESHNFEDKQKIAGVLWQRIEIGMLLQVDAVFPYILGKDISRVLFENLEIDSPYNTYLYLGLPPGAIANPGLDSIEAAVTPIKDSYLYYLADKEGNTHFSETFEEHKRKKELYLN